MKKLQQMPMFWMNLCLLLCVLIVSLSGLWISNYILAKNQKDFLIDKIELQINENCEEFSHYLYQTQAIPLAIENTKYFDHIRAITTGQLPDEYVPVLSMIRKALSSQVYLYGEAEESILFFHGAGSAVSREKCFVDSNECFEQYLQFGHWTAEETEAFLNDSGSIKILPVQDVSINSKKLGNCLILYVNPVLSNISVMTIYSEHRVLEMLDTDMLPEGTYIEVATNAGEVLLEHGQKSVQMEEIYQVKVPLKELNATVLYQIPQSWFSYMALPAKRMSLFLFFVTALIGVFLSIKLSDVSIKSLRDLLRLCIGDAEPLQETKINEVQQVSAFIGKTKEELHVLQASLGEQLLLRASLGVFLTKKENEWLDRFVKERLDGPFRLALFSVSENIFHNDVMKLFEGCLKNGGIYQLVNLEEGIVLFTEDDKYLESLEKSWLQMKEDESLGNITERCKVGISGTFSDMEQLYTAIRQARIAAYEGNIIGVYKEGNKTFSMDWMMQERLYQRLLSNDKMNVYELVEKITQSSYYGKNGISVFYNLLFVVKSAAEELGLEISAIEAAEYDWKVSPRKNIGNIFDIVDEFFRQVEYKNQLVVDKRNTDIMAYIQNNYYDENMCLSKVAESLGISEKNISSVIKKSEGKSFSEYLLMLRMRKAASLLCSTSMDVVEIGLACGYSSESSFYRVFKKYYNMTPNQYRQGV